MCAYLATPHRVFYSRGQETGPRSAASPDATSSEVAVDVRADGADGARHVTYNAIVQGAAGRNMLTILGVC